MQAAFTRCFSKLPKPRHRLFRILTKWHLALFFAQIWLLTKAFRTDNRPIPYRSLMVFALCFAVVSECAQEWLTETRTGSLGDIFADLTGALLALFAARSANRPG